MNGLKATIKRVAGGLPGMLPDAMLIAGAGLVSYGAYMVYEPAGYMVCGVFFLIGGWFVARSAT